MMLEQQVAAVLAVARIRAAMAQRTEELRADQRGEVGSWLILAAALAIAAAAVGGSLSGWIGEKGAEITSN